MDNSSKASRANRAFIPVTEEEAAMLNMERTVHPSESNKQLANRLLEEGLPAAVQGLNHLALHATNENTRLKAQQYIIDRNLGRVGEQKPDADDSFRRFMEEVTS